MCVFVSVHVCVFIRVFVCIHVCECAFCMCGGMCIYCTHAYVDLCSRWRMPFWATRCSPTTTVPTLPSCVRKLACCREWVHAAVAALATLHYDTHSTTLWVCVHLHIYLFLLMFVLMFGTSVFPYSHAKTLLRWYWVDIIHLSVCIRSECYSFHVPQMSDEYETSTVILSQYETAVQIWPGWNICANKEAEYRKLYLRNNSIVMD